MARRHAVARRQYGSLTRSLEGTETFPLNINHLTLGSLEHSRAGLRDGKAQDEKWGGRFFQKPFFPGKIEGKLWNIFFYNDK